MKLQTRYNKAKTENDRVIFVLNYLKTASQSNQASVALSAQIWKHDGEMVLGCLWDHARISSEVFKKLKPFLKSEKEYDEGRSSISYHLK